jgi:hypothetical protein
MNEPIIDKIKKLLRLGRSPNQHEAELAMQRAFELAEKHRVDVEALDLDEREAAVVHEWFQVGARMSFLKKRALNIVIHFFHVDVCVSRPRVVFVGRSTDIAIAHYVWAFLVTAGTRCLRAYEAEEKAARRKIGHNKRTSFVQGFIYGIANTLRRSKAQRVLTDSQSALVLAEDHARAAHLADLIPEQKTLAIEGPKRRHASALDAGYDAGRATSIHQPLNAAPGGPLLLT